MFPQMAILANYALRTAPLSDIISRDEGHIGWSHRQAEKSPLVARSDPRHLFLKDMTNQMSETDISVFVDESGTFDSDKEARPPLHGEPPSRRLW